MSRVLLSVLLAFSLGAFAEQSNEYNIKKIEVGEGGFNIYPVGGTFDSANCSDGTSSTVNYAISFKQEYFPNGYAHILSVALAAKMGNAKVTMWYVGCQPSPWGNGNMPKPGTLVLE